MEKCSMCVHRINRGTRKAKEENRELQDGEIKTACQEACTTGAITFGDLNDPESEVSQLAQSDRKYTLMPQLNTQPNVVYLATVDPYKDKNLGEAKTNEH
jgi:molybdopterin-containing oxidoreductase family iron-sulfur binding subunit